MKIRTDKSNLQILYEDNHLIIVNKRAGDIVQGDKTNDQPLSEVVKEYIAHTYQKPGAVYLGVVHRLDRPTTGIVIFAKTSKALARLNKQFSEREVQKNYWAVVKQSPIAPSARLVHFLTRNTKQNKSYAHKQEVAGSKKAILDYQIIGQSEQYFLLEIELHSGRHHQIRAQLNSMGCPIKGDLKYGYPRSNPDGSIHLHARKLIFLHPVKKEEIVIEAPVPQESLWQLLADQI